MHVSPSPLRADFAINGSTNAPSGPVEQPAIGPRKAPEFGLFHHLYSEVGGLYLSDSLPCPIAADKLAVYNDMLQKFLSGSGIESIRRDGVPNVIRFAMTHKSPSPSETYDVALKIEAKPIGSFGAVRHEVVDIEFSHDDPAKCFSVRAPVADSPARPGTRAFIIRQERTAASAATRDQSVREEVTDLATQLNMSSSPNHVLELWQKTRLLCQSHDVSTAVEFLADAANSVISVLPQIEDKTAQRNAMKWLDSYFSIGRKYGSNDVQIRIDAMRVQAPVWHSLMTQLPDSGEGFQRRIFLGLFKETDPAGLRGTEHKELVSSLAQVSQRLTVALAEGRIHHDNRPLATAVIARLAADSGSTAPLSAQKNAATDKSESPLTRGQAAKYRAYLAEQIANLEQVCKDPSVTAKVMLPLIMSQNKRTPGLNAMHFDYVWQLANYMRDFPDHADYLNAVIGTKGSHNAAIIVLKAEQKIAPWVIDSSNGMYEDDAAYQLKQWETRLRMDTSYDPADALISSISIQKDGKSCGSMSLEELKKCFVDIDNTKKVLQGLLAKTAPENSYEHPFSKHLDMRVHQLRMASATQVLSPAHYKHIQDQQRLDDFIDANNHWDKEIVNKKGQTLHQRILAERNRKGVTTIKASVETKKIHYASASNSMQRWAESAIVDLKELQKHDDGGVAAWMNELRQISPLRLNDGTVTDSVIGVTFHDDEHMDQMMAAIEASNKRSEISGRETRIASRINCEEGRITLEKSFIDRIYSDEVDFLPADQVVKNGRNKRRLDLDDLLLFDFDMSDNDSDTDPPEIVRPFKRAIERLVNADSNNASEQREALRDVKNYLKEFEDIKNAEEDLDALFTWWGNAPPVSPIDAKLFEIFKNVDTNQAVRGRVSAMVLRRLSSLIQSNIELAMVAVRFASRYIEHAPPEVASAAVKAMLNAPLSDTLRALNSRHQNKLLNTVGSLLSGFEHESMKACLHPLWMQTAVLLRDFPELADKLVSILSKCFEDIPAHANLEDKQTLQKLFNEYPNIVDAASAAVGDGKLKLREVQRLYDAVTEAINAAQNL